MDPKRVEEVLVKAGIPCVVNESDDPQLYDHEVVVSKKVHVQVSSDGGKDVSVWREREDGNFVDYGFSKPLTLVRDVRKALADEAKEVGVPK